MRRPIIVWTERAYARIGRAAAWVRVLHRAGRPRHFALAWRLSRD